MAYCNLTTDLSLRGISFDSKTSLTSFTPEKLQEYQYIIEDDIHAKLNQAGVTVPISISINPYVYRRLKYLEALGINMLMEQAQYTRSQPAMDVEVENTSTIFKKDYEQKLKAYCDDPEFTLFQGETNFTALDSRRRNQPVGRIIYSEVSNLIENGEYDPYFKIDSEW